MREPLADRLRETGHKITGPRRAVLHVLETAGQHVSPAEVLEQGRAIYPALSRATVYRTLDLLVDLGVLRPVCTGARGSQVVFVEGGHHHMICLDCGAVIHFDACAMDDLGQSLAERFGFQVKSHMLEVYGRCEDCQKKMHATAPSPASSSPPRKGG